MRSSMCPRRVVTSSNMTFQMDAYAPPPDGGRFRDSPEPADRAYTALPMTALNVAQDANERYQMYRRRDSMSRLASSQSRSHPR